MLDPVLDSLYERANEFYWRLTEVASPDLLTLIAPDLQHGAAAYKHGLSLLLKAAVALPSVARGFSAAWPPAVREVVPGAGVGVRIEQTWTPLLAYLLFHALPGTADSQAVLDALDMRSALAEAFAEVGLQGEDSWRYAARVRLLLGGRVALDALHTEGFWAESDVRWLAGVNDSQGVSYVNKESFEELLCWLQLPGLLGLAGALGGDDAYETPLAELAEIEAAVQVECQRLAGAGYNLSLYLGEQAEAEPETEQGEIIAH